MKVDTDLLEGDFSMSLIRRCDKKDCDVRSELIILLARYATPIVRSSTGNAAAGKYFGEIVKVLMPKTDCTSVSIK